MEFQFFVSLYSLYFTVNLVDDGASLKTKISGSHRHFLQLDGLLGGLLSCSLGCTFVGIVTAQIVLLAEAEISHEL